MRAAREEHRRLRAMGINTKKQLVTRARRMTCPPLPRKTASLTPAKSKSPSPKSTPSKVSPTDIQKSRGRDKVASKGKAILSPEPSATDRSSEAEDSSAVECVSSAAMKTKTKTTANKTPARGRKRKIACIDSDEEEEEEDYQEDEDEEEEE